MSTPHATPNTRVAFVLHSEFGHLSPALAFAQRLKKDGFYCTFIMLSPELMALVRDAGFAVEPLCPESASEPFFANPDQYFRYLYGRKLRNRFLGEALARGEHDVVLVDGVLPQAALTAINSGHRVVTFHTQLPWADRPEYPRLSSRLVPKEGHWGALQIKANSVLEAARKTKLLGNRRLLYWQGKLPSYDTRADWRKMCEESKYEGRFTYTEEGLVHLVDLPQLAVFPGSFDRYDAKDEHRVYVGPCLREGIGEGSESLPDSSKVVYVAFGSQAKHYPKVRRIQDKLLEAISLLPKEWGAVVSTPFSAEELGVGGSSRILTSPFTNQRALLKSVDLFVSHCGAGSVREALYEGVPILCYPQMWDQFGTASRVEVGGVGKVGSENWSPAKIANVIVELSEIRGSSVMRDLQERYRNDDYDTALTLLRDN